MLSRAEAADVIACLEQYSTRIPPIHGDWDRAEEVKDYLEEKGYSLHGEGWIFGKIGFFVMSGSSPTLLNTATEYTEEESALTLQTGYEQVKEASQVVMNSPWSSPGCP